MSDAVIVGFDIGGTKTAVVLGRADGSVLERVEIATRPQDGFATSFARIKAAGEGVFARSSERGLVPTDIGVSIGGPLDPHAGIIYSPPNLPGWDDIPLKRLLSEAFAVPVTVEHDGLAGAMAERRYGVGRGAQNLIFLTMGTGIGAGMILGGRPYRGAGGSAGSVGHLRMAEDGPEAWGKAGSWEAFSSGSGLAALARWKYPDQFSEGTTGKTVAERAAAGDAAAADVLRISAMYLGRGMAVLIDILNPELIVLGSLAARLGDILLGPALEVVRAEAEPGALSDCRIVPSALGARIGDLAPLAAVCERSTP